MVNVIFILNGNSTHIHCTENQKMKEIIDKFYQKNQNFNKETIHFLYSGSEINPELTFLEQANSYDKEKKEMNILVYTEDEPSAYNEKLTI